MHVFEKQFGPGPYTFLGCFSIKQNSIGQFGISGYKSPRFLTGHGTCAHCGTAIKNVYQVEAASGDVFGVGSECILKTGDTHLVKEIKKAISATTKAKRITAKVDTRSAIIDLANANLARLEALEHPRGFINKNFADYVEWMLSNAGAKGQKGLYSELKKVLTLV